MKLQKIVVIVTVVALLIVTSNIRAITARRSINLGQSTNYNYYHNSLIASSREILQISESNFANFKFRHQKISLCKINQRSTSESWINLLGRLIILGSFTSFGVMSNSARIERYIKLIFQDILPIFLIIFISISLFGIASVIASTSFSSSTLLPASSLNSPKTCILK